MPRVRYEADYLDRLWFRDVIDIEVNVADVGRTSVIYTFAVRRDDAVVARGRMVTVRSDPVAGGGSQPSTGLTTMPPTRPTPGSR